MRGVRGVASLLVLAVASSCVGERQTSEPPRLRATIDLRIGEENESREEYIFGFVDGLAFGDDGRILVADAKDNTVRVFSAIGQHLYTIGRQGQGPGDLSGPCCLLFASNGLLWIKENGNHRYSSFRLGETSATFVGSVRGTTNYVVRPDRVDFDARGRLIDLALAYMPARNALGIVRLRLDSSGTVAERDTVPTPPADSLSTVSFASGGGTATYSQPYGAESLHAFGAGGEAAHGVSSRYAVAWMDASGKLRTLAQRDVGAGPALSDKERAATVKELETIAAQARVPRSELPLEVPNRKSPLVAIGFDLEGRLWIERSVTDGQPGEADVYDRQGRWSAVFQWPRAVSMRFWTVHGLTGLGIEEGADGAQRVVRLHFR